VGDPENSARAVRTEHLGGDGTGGCGVEVSGRLVEHHHVVVAQQCPGDGQPGALAAGHLRVAFSDERVHPFRERGDPRAEAGVGERPSYVVVGGVRAGEAHVLHDSGCEDVWVVIDQGHHAAQVIGGDLTGVTRTESDLARGRVEEAQATKPEPVAAPAPPPAPVAAAPTPAPTPAAKPAVDPSEAIKKRFEQNLNGGQPADGSLAVAQLQKDDLIYASGSVLAVVRRFGPRNQLFWLTGELNLERSELVVTGPDRYRVSEPIRNSANPTLRGGSTKGAAKFVATVPAAKSPARSALEKQYNDGRDIVGILQPAELHSGDLIYTTEGAAVVIRRSSVGMERFWFVGELDLHQTGLQLQGNAIRVLTDAIK